MYKKRDLFDYILTQNMKSPNDPSFETLIRNLDDSEFEFPTVSYALDAYYDVVNAAAGYVIEFPSFQGDIKQFIIENLKYYGSEEEPWDFIHPCA